MQQAVTYQQRSRELLARAYSELDTDPAQAGEKGWGAAAEMVKAIAAQRGLYHQSHRALYEIVDALVRETGDREISTLFSSANDLHFNFYENWFGRESIEFRIQNIELFVGKVEALLSPAM